ncbi:MAG: Hpt domain-containing protein [Planctomycetota bacterium]|nr:Hpt domain-containing protein [Planctomycetota bacterium]
MARTFNEEELLEQVDGDVEFLAETAEMLTDDAPRLASDIRAAISAGDSEAVGRHAHTLKGMVSNFCAPRAQAIALELERAGKSGDLSAAPALLQQLESHLTELTAELNEFIEARS